MNQTIKIKEGGTWNKKLFKVKEEVSIVTVSGKLIATLNDDIVTKAQKEWILKMVKRVIPDGSITTTSGKAILTLSGDYIIKF